MNKDITINDTPIIQQYNNIKSKYKNMILLFRIGDFYETFNEDAIKISNILGILLTKKNNGVKGKIPLAGFPYHSLNIYLPKIIKHGEKVAICEQLEQAQESKNIIKRDVVEIITPGVCYIELSNTNYNYLSCIYISNSRDIIGISFIDISTGEFVTHQGYVKSVHNLLYIYKPSEILISKNKQDDFYHLFKNIQYNIEIIDDWVFNYYNCYKILLNHFKINNLKIFNIDVNYKQSIIASGVCLHYIYENHYNNISHINKIQYLNDKKYMSLSDFTIKNLELINSNYKEGISLFDTINKTQSYMGARILKKWLLMPLIDIKKIKYRQSIVELLINNKDLRYILKTNIKKIGDLKRLSAKISLKKATWNDFIELYYKLLCVNNIYNTVKCTDNKEFKNLILNIIACNDILNIINQYIDIENYNYNYYDYNIIKSGASLELDILKKNINNIHHMIVQLEQFEIKRNKIPSLKILNNNIIGYFIEVNSSYNKSVHYEWIWKQTLKNKIRYTTKQLQNYETSIIFYKNQISIIENNIFDKILNNIISNINTIQINSDIIAQLDVLLSFSFNSIEKTYVKPIINQIGVIDIKKGRHPVIENNLSSGISYVSNDISLNNEKQQILIITGPNMSGKSAILRQTGIIVIMSHIGSFIPAKSANIALTDKIFTRVGASDNISAGESTFMLEMHETSNIINNMSNNSLILLDEIGRGTSTYDGISIAWSIIDYIHNNSNILAKTIFATHYHELSNIAKYCKRVKNYNVEVKKIDNNIYFLYNLIPGTSEYSFGINVAKMAGMPKIIIENANKILEILKRSNCRINFDKLLNYKQTYKNNFFYKLKLFLKNTLIK